MNLLHGLPTIRWPAHKTPSKDGHKPPKEPRQFHRSRIKTTTISMVIVTLTFIAHLCHGEELSDQRYATLRSVTKTTSFEPSSNQVILHSPPFAMMAIKTARGRSHSRPHSHAKTADDKPTTQKRTTPNDGLQIQSWSIKRWASIHTKQAITNGWVKGRMLGLCWKKCESIKASKKVVCHWMTPVAKIKFSSRRAALKFEDLRKKFQYNKAQAWNEHLKVPARVESSSLQFLATHDGAGVVNKASSRVSQEISPIKTNSTTPRVRCAPSAPSSKFSVGPGSKSTSKNKINNAFGMYATSIREKKNPPILHERPSKMKEGDAPKFVTPRKRTKNKKPTTFDGDDSPDSDPCSHSSSDSDNDHVDLFSFNVKDDIVKLLAPPDDDDNTDDDNEENGAVSIKATCNSNPRENQSVTPLRSYNSDGDSFSLDTAHLLPLSLPPLSSASASATHGMEDRFLEDDDEWTSVPTRCPSRSIVTKKNIKKENAKLFQCHNLSFVMPFPKPTCMTRASMHDLIPSETTDKKGRLLSPTARSDLPVRRLQYPWHGEFVIHCNSNVMNMDRQLNPHQSRRANHQENRTNQFDSDLKPFEGSHQVDGIQNGIDIKKVETFKLEDDDGQAHTMSVLDSICVPLLKKVILAPHHLAQATHDITSKPRGTWMTTYDDCIILYDIMATSNHSQHWKRKSDLDGDSYDAITYIEPSWQHQTTRMSNKVTWLLREQQQFNTRHSIVHPSSFVRIFEDSEAKGFREDEVSDKYYKSYYLKLSPSNPSIKSALLSIKEFESLTYEHGLHKTHSRLKLLVSPSYRGMHKIGRAGLFHFDNCQESSKSRYKQRTKEIVADIKGTSQQLWSKSEGDLDGDLCQCIWSSRMIDNQHIQPNGQFVFQPLIKEMTRPSSSLRSTQEVIGAQVASPFLRELSNCSFWRSFTDSEHCAYFHDQQPSDLTKTLDNSSTTTKKVSSPILRNPLRTTYRSSETLAQIDKAREHETVYIMILTFPKFTSVRRNPSSPNVVQVTVDAFTSWYIQDLMVVKEDIEEYKFQIPSPMTIPWYAPFYFVNSISKGTCAQGKLRYFPLEPWIKPQTLQQRHYHRTHSSDIANPCVNSNPRCPSKGV